MRSHLFRLKQIGVLLLLAGLTWLAAVSDIGTIFGLGFSFQGAVLLLAFRWYGRMAGMSLALASGLYHFVYLHNITIAVLGVAEIALATVCVRWIKDKGLLPFAIFYWLVIAPLLTTGLYYVTFGQLGSELSLLLLHNTGNGGANALLAELVYCYLPWRPDKGWRRANVSLSLKRFLLHFAMTAVLLPFLVFMGAWCSFHHDEIESHAQRQSESVFGRLSHELNNWEEKDLGLLHLNALVQWSRLEGITRSLKEASGAEIVVAMEEKQIVAATMPASISDKGEWKQRYRAEQLSPNFSVWMPNQYVFSSIELWNGGYYVYEAALAEAPLQIAVLIPTTDYVQRLQHMHTTIYGLFMGLMAIAAAAGYALGGWISGELQGIGRVSSYFHRQLNGPKTGPRLYAIEEFRGLADHLGAAWRRQQSVLQHLEQTNQSLEYQMKELEHRKEYWEHMACHDPLTGLCNRLYFFNMLEKYMREQYGSGESVGVIYMDLDNFKQMNDQYGHAAGDELLRQVAGRICSAVEKGSVCRLGGDEFVVLVPSTRSAEVESLSGQLVQALQQPFSINGQEMNLKSSLGISLYPQDAYDAKTMMQYADEAMYQAKASGGDRYAFYADRANPKEQHIATGGAER